jgi:cytochrome c
VQPAGAAPAQEAKPQPIGPLLASADPAAGDALTKKLCAACHTFNEGGKAGVGPNLFGVVGAPHGHMEGFAYSSALKGKQGPWNYDELNEWLTKPSAYAPGTKMTFAGLSSEKQRADVIAYLRTLSHNPEPLPAAAPAAAPAAQTANPSAGGAAAPNAATQGTEAGKAAGETQPKAQ